MYVYRERYSCMLSHCFLCFPCRKSLRRLIGAARPNALLKGSWVAMCFFHAAFLCGLRLRKGIVARLLRHPQNLEFSKQSNGSNNSPPTNLSKTVCSLCVCF